MKLDHKHIIVNATVNKPPAEGDEDKVVDWMKRLVEAVGMKLVIGPFAHYCKADENEGITATCCIETSHSSLHVWDKLDPPLLRFDLYSCATFNPEIVKDMIQEFEPIKLDYILVDRNDGIEVVPKYKLILQKYLIPEATP